VTVPVTRPRSTCRSGDDWLKPLARAQELSDEIDRAIRDTYPNVKRVFVEARCEEKPLRELTPIAATAFVDGSARDSSKNHACFVHGEPRLGHQLFAT
jgi:hypothetical protein